MNEEQRRRIVDRTTAIVTTFTTEYIRAYKDALISKIKKEYQKEPKEPKQLLTPPVPTEPLKQGWLVKQGGAIKSWKKRWFVVHPNYTIDYLEKPGGKKKGDINLDGYTVEAKGLEGKPFSIELHHNKRRCWFIQCASEEEKKDWIDVFKLCCRFASRATSNSDPVMAYAFQRAYERTRWSLYLWGWYSYSGSEGERLGELITEELERTVLSEIFRTLPGSGKMQEIARNSIMKVVESIVVSTVEAGWKKCCEVIDEVKKTIEGVVRKLVEPVFQTEKDLKEKIKEAIMDTVNPALQQIVVPPLAKVLDVVMGPIRASYAELFKAWRETATKFQQHVAEKTHSEASMKEWMHNTYWVVWYYWGPMRPVIDKVNEMREPLELLGDIASYVRAWKIIEDVTDHQRDLLYKACYTVTQDLHTFDGDVRAAIKKTSDRLLHDAQLQIVKEYFNILSAIVTPPFNQEIIPAVSKLVDPLNDIIPEPVKDLVNPKKTLQDLLKELVKAVIKSCIDGAAKDEPSRLADAFTALAL